MKLQDVQRLELPASADMHVHLRQHPVTELVVPHVRKGGVDTCFVMPNLQPPVTDVKRALAYRDELKTIDPDVNYLMSLYLHKDVTPAVIEEAAKAGITGVKMYPQGVTTNSEAGVSEIEDFYDVFKAMEAVDMVLNLHGEVHGDLPAGCNTHEEAFLPTLAKLHDKFPKLRIILEHCSTAAALEAVKKCGPNVAGTITAHHLYLTGDDSSIDPLAFCKPIPKTKEDQDALIKAVASGNPKFFFGSDSAPHLFPAKQARDGKPPPAGVFTQPFATQLVLMALERAQETTGVLAEGDVTQPALESFLSAAGRAFYKLPPAAARLVLEKKGETIPTSIQNADGSLEIGLSKAGAPVYSLEWVS